MAVEHPLGTHGVEDFGCHDLRGPSLGVDEQIDARQVRDRRRKLLGAGDERSLARPAVRLASVDSRGDGLGGRAEADDEE